MHARTTACFAWPTRCIQTRPQVIERQRLFKRGEPVPVRLIEATERLLRSDRYLYDVKFLPTPVHDGVVDIEVVTRDTWSLGAGANAGGVHIAEYKLLGTGTRVTLGRRKTVDRTSTMFGLANRRAFGTWTDPSLGHTVNSDGRRDAVAVLRPFDALDTRWAAGISAGTDDRIDSVCQGGSIASQYRQRQNLGEAFVGWSPGLVDGWVHRGSTRFAKRSDADTQSDEVSPRPWPRQVARLSRPRRWRNRGCRRRHTGRPHRPRPGSSVRRRALGLHAGQQRDRRGGTHEVSEFRGAGSIGRP